MVHHTRRFSRDPAPFSAFLREKARHHVLLRIAAATDRLQLKELDFASA
jgi:hypothetical protein